MRRPVPENKVFFIRFHKEIERMIEEYAEEQKKKRATAVRLILEEYISSPFPLSPLSSSFFLKRGRSKGKVVGKGMNITIKRVIENEIKIRAEREGIREKDFKTSIIFSFLQKEKD